MKRLALLALAFLLASPAAAQMSQRPSGGGVASSAEVINLWTGTCDGTTWLRADGTCAAPSGAGDALTTDGLEQFAATTSAELRGVLSDEVGTGAAYFVGGALGTPASGTATNLTGTAAGLTAGAATALAGDPTDCGANTYATTIAANGNLTCTEVAIAGIAATGTPDDTTFLRGDGSWTTPSGSGDVTAASNFGTDNVVVRADGTSKGVQASGISINDSDDVTGVNDLAVGGDLTVTGTVIASNLTPFSGSLTDGGALYTDGTNIKSGAALTLNSVVLGGGAAGSGPKVSSSIGTDGGGGLSLGTAGSVVGILQFFNGTSGNILLAPPSTGALGTNIVLRLPIKATESVIAVRADTGYAVQFGGTWGSPTDGATVYFGTAHLVSATDGFHRIFFPRSGTLKSVYCNVLVAGTLGTTEQGTLAFRLNATTDTNISTAVQWDAATQSYSVTGLSVAIAAGDHGALKLITPTWATNPTSTGYQCTAWVESLS